MQHLSAVKIPLGWQSTRKLRQAILSAVNLFAADCLRSPNGGNRVAGLGSTTVAGPAPRRSLVNGLERTRILGGYNMNWDQIERKWDEMTRRVQSPSSLSTTIQGKSSRDEPELESVDGQAGSADLTERSSEAKLWK